jgi:hypothetical protein
LIYAVLDRTTCCFKILFSFRLPKNCFKWSSSSSTVFGRLNPSISLRYFGAKLLNEGMLLSVID